MTTQLLNSELANLLQESKRKHSELRNATEKSLEELKGLRSTSETQVAADLSQRPNFVTPFLIACGTKNVKFTGIAIVCLQRLILSRALPVSRLREVLEAFREATPAGLDVQLKILQALPSLLHNYSDDLKGTLLAAALNICTILQSCRNNVVINTAAATLQQLVVSVFDKVVAEDKIALEVPTVGDAPSENGSIRVRAAALDAYNVFNDLCLLTESEKPQFLKSASLPQTFGLELIESVLTNHCNIFITHPEQANILRVRVMPFIISSLSERFGFAVTVRTVRVLFTLLRRHLSILTTEGEMALGLLTHMLDQDTALWKRSLCMEVLRGLFADAALIRWIFATYDAQEDRKPILRDLVAAFVRISTEKPVIIGIGHQSSVPAQNQSSGADQAMLEATGIPGVISSSSTSGELPIGISVQWSTMRVPCIDQLDKSEPPSIPDSYIYSLTLSCISGFSEGLAKFILPLTVPDRPRKQTPKRPENEQQKSDSPDDRQGVLRRSPSKKQSVLVNPLLVEGPALAAEVKICAGIIDGCWPAVLATCSTFLYATLDSDYYHGLVRSFQKFAHVAGLLRLATPRDAFLTTLGKAAVPSSVLTASITQTAVTASPATESPSIFSNARGLLSVDSLVSQSDRGRQASLDSAPSSLNTRNLLCLRALLNLGIALGPTLDDAWAIILGTLQQADLVLFSSAKSARTPSNNQKSDYQNLTDTATLMINFGTEIKAVETAASRLFESTVDFQDEPFLQVINALCNLVGKQEEKDEETHNGSAPPPPNARRPSISHRRLHSLNTAPPTINQEILFALSKLGDIAIINIERFLTSGSEASGWKLLSEELMAAACSVTMPSSVRLRAVEILVRLVLESASATLSLPDERRFAVQLRLLQTFSKALKVLTAKERETSVSVHTTDNEVHRIILEGLKDVLEQSGETFVGGWEVVFDVISSVFTGNESSNAKPLKPSPAHSAKLIRCSFNSLQLICSDFLSSLPNSCFIMLVDTLSHFCTQDEDINISLTAVTFFWVLSDFISNRSNSVALGSDMLRGSDEQKLVEKASEDDLTVSGAALWMLLLLRLTAVTTDERLELRNSAIQTLFRIFDAYGDRLSPEAWATCLQSVIFRLLSAIEAQLRVSTDAESLLSNKDRRGWNETTVVVMSGIASLISEHLNVLSGHSTFSSSWKTLLDHFQTLLKFEVLEINTSVFKTLKQLLAQGNRKDEDKFVFDNAAIDLAWALWSDSLPRAEIAKTDKVLDNHDYLVAYISALQEIYPLLQADLIIERVDRMLALLRETIQNASASSYSADIENATPLQNQVLLVLKMIRTDIRGVTSSLINQLAEFVSLPFEGKLDSPLPGQRPTYIALSKAAMVLMENLILAHASDLSVYSSGAFSSSLAAFSKPIALKYSFPIITKSISPWRQATTSSLSVLNVALPYVSKLEQKDDNVQSIWTSIITIANGITTANCDDAPDNVNIADDQEFDITSFTTLHALIIPALGSPLVPDKLRRTFTESLFHRSLIHIHQPNEFQKLNTDLLAIIYKPRKGSTVDPSPSPRSKMSYVCFDELCSLVAISDSSPLRIKLAQAAAPYLILRAGLAIRAYNADQPLRGRMPQPRSQRMELLYILKALVALRCEPKSIPDAPGVESEGRKHLHRLYPLLTKAVRAARWDQDVLEWIGKALDEVGIEFGI